jgi:hypothetical protein
VSRDHGASLGRFAGIDFEEGRQDLAGPAIDIVLSHGGSHPQHPSSALGGLHLKREPDALAEFVDGERIEVHGVGKLEGGPGEFAHEQYAVIVGQRDLPSSRLPRIPWTVAGISFEICATGQD